MNEQSGVQPPAVPPAPSPKQAEAPPKTYPELALGNRYIAAWGEINARIQGRDNIFLTFVVAAIAIIAAALSSDNPVLAVYLPLAVPWMAFILTQVWTAHDLLIGYLSKHLVDVARESGPDKDWDWHVGSKYRRGIYRRRAFMDFGHVLAVMILSGVALETSSTLEKCSLEPEQLTIQLHLPPLVSSRGLEGTIIKTRPLRSGSDTLFVVGNKISAEVKKQRPILLEDLVDFDHAWWGSLIFAIVTAVQTLVILYLRVRGVWMAAENSPS